MGKEKVKKKASKALTWNKRKKILVFIVSPILLMSLLLFVVLPVYTHYQSQEYEGQSLEEGKDREEQSLNLINVAEVEEEDLVLTPDSASTSESDITVQPDFTPDPDSTSEPVPTPKPDPISEPEPEPKSESKSEFEPTAEPEPILEPTKEHAESLGDDFVKRVSKGEKIAITSEFGGRVGGPLITLQLFDEDGSIINPLETGHLVGEIGQTIETGKYHKPLDHSMVGQFDGMKLHIACRNYGEAVYALTEGWLSKLLTTEHDDLPNVNYLILAHDDGGKSIYSHIE